jgi:protein associated with RNAse G/E
MVFSLKLEKGDLIRIESLKYGGRLHRIWKGSVVLRAGDPLVLANFNAEVVERDGKEWIFPGLAVCFFSATRWYHTVMLYDDTFHLKEYYCHIASPCRFDGKTKTLSFTDFDLDLIARPDLSFRWVDQDEFEANRIRYSYPKDVVSRIETAKKELERAIRRNEEPFAPEFAEFWYHQFLSLNP